MSSFSHLWSKSSTFFTYSCGGKKKKKFCKFISLFAVAFNYTGNVKHKASFVPDPVIFNRNMFLWKHSMILWLYEKGVLRSLPGRCCSGDQVADTVCKCCQAPLNTWAEEGESLVEATISPIFFCSGTNIGRCLFLLFFPSFLGSPRG